MSIGNEILPSIFFSVLRLLRPISSIERLFIYFEYHKGSRKDDEDELSTESQFILLAPSKLDIRGRLVNRVSGDGWIELQHKSSSRERKKFINIVKI